MPGQCIKRGIIHSLFWLYNDTALEIITLQDLKKCAKYNVCAHGVPSNSKNKLKMIRDKANGTKNEQAL